MTSCAKFSMTKGRVGFSKKLPIKQNLEGERRGGGVIKPEYLKYHDKVRKQFIFYMITQLVFLFKEF